MLVVASALSQAVSFALMPVITHLYSPEDYGVYATFIAIVLIIYPVVAWRLNAAITISDNDSDAQGLFCLSWLAVLITVVALQVVTCICYFFLGLGEPEYLYVPVVLLVMGFCLTSQSRLIYINKFKGMAYARIVDNISDRLLAIVLALVIAGGVSAVFLVLARIVGATASFLVSIIYLKVNASLTFTLLSYSRAITLLSKYRSYLLYSTPSLLLDSFGRYVPVLVFAFFYTPEDAAFFLLAMQLVNMPIVLLGDGLANSFIKYSSDNRSNIKGIANLILDVSVLLLYLFVPVSLVLLCFGELLFSIVFGELWRSSGWYASVLISGTYFMLIHRVFSGLFELYGRQRVRFIFDVFLVLAKLLVVCLVVFFDSPAIYVVVGVTLVNIFVYLFAVFYLYRFVLKQALVVLPFFKALVVNVPLLFVLYLNWQQWDLLSYAVLVACFLVFSVCVPFLKEGRRAVRLISYR